MKLTKAQARSFARASERYGVRLALLYGSRATGAARRKSDTDIGVLAATSLTLAQQHRVKTAFSKALGLPTDRIDLVDLRAAPPLLSYFIARDGMVITGTDRAADHFYRSAMKQFIDTKRLRDATEHYVKTNGA